MADAKASEPVKSTQQLDLEARQAEDYQSPLVISKGVNPGESLASEDGFIGVDPIYQNNANETEAPLAASEGAEKSVEDRVLNQETTSPEPAAAPAPAPKTTTAKTAEPKQG